MPLGTASALGTLLAVWAHQSHSPGEGALRNTARCWSQLQPPGAAVTMPVQLAAVLSSKVFPWPPASVCAPCGVGKASLREGVRPKHRMDKKSLLPEGTAAGGRLAAAGALALALSGSTERIICALTQQAHGAESAPAPALHQLLVGVAWGSQGEGPSTPRAMHSRRVETSVEHGVLDANTQR